MAKRREESNRSVVAPLLGSGALGAGAYGSYKLDNLLDRLGIKKGLKINPEALEAVSAYADLKPEAINPSRFALQYSQAANNAANAQLFLNDPRRVWEWEINTPELRENVSKELTKLRSNLVPKANKLSNFIRKLSLNGLASRVDSLSHKIDGTLSEGIEFFSPLDEAIRSKPGAAKQAIKTWAHTPEMSRSQLHSYVRLLNEVAPGVHSDAVADNTLEALLNYKNPTYKPYIGKVFKSPAEYFNLMQGGTAANMPNVFDDYISSFDDIVKNYGSNRGELMAQIRKSLGTRMNPYKGIGRTDIARALKKTIGDTSTWGFDPASKTMHVVSDMKLNPSIRTVQDIIDRGGNLPWLKFLNAQAAINYKPAGKGYGKIVKRLSLLQKLRSSKGRIGLAAGALGLGGLAAHNMFRNFKDKNKK